MIWLEAATEIHGTTRFSRRFQLTEVPKRVTLRVAATGFFEAFLNDVKVDNRVLTPPPVYTEKRILRIDFDVISGR